MDVPIEPIVPYCAFSVHPEKEHLHLLFNYSAKKFKVTKIMETKRSAKKGRKKFNRFALNSR